jgi:hypothetical protein
MILKINYQVKFELLFIKTKYNRQLTECGKLYKLI